MGIGQGVVDVLWKREIYVSSFVGGAAATTKPWESVFNFKNLKAQGQSAIEDAQDEFGQIEKQIKDTIREKPLTAVAGAVALGFILAVVSR